MDIGNDKVMNMISMLLWEEICLKVRVKASQFYGSFTPVTLRMATEHWFVILIGMNSLMNIESSPKTKIEKVR